MNELSEEQKSMTNIDYMFKRKKEKNSQGELALQKDICDYLQEYYPEVYFITDPLGLHVSPHIQRIFSATNSKHKHIDLPIFKKSLCSQYSMLILEIKIETPFKLNGEIKASKDDHLLKQYHVMLKLRSEGYRVEYAWTLDMAKDYIHGHIGTPKPDNTPLF